MKINLRNKFNNYDYLIIVLIALLIGTSLYPVFQSIGILAIPYLLLNFNKEYYRGYQMVKTFIVLFILFNIISFLWSDDSALFTNNLISLLYLSSNFLLLVTFSAKANNPIRSIIYGWMLLVILTIPIAFYEINTDIHFSSKYADKDVYIHGEDIFKKTFAATTFNNMNSYTTILCLSLPIVTSLVFSKFKALPRLFIVVILMNLSCIIIINSSRGGVISLFATVLIFSFFYFKYNAKSFWSIILAIAIVFVVSVYIDTVMYQFSQRMTGKSSLVDDGYRSSLIVNGLAIFADNPLGIGIANMESEFSKHPGATIHIPHNMFIEFLLYGGLIFFSCFIFGIIKTYIRGIKSESKVIRYIFYASTFSIVPAAVINSGYFFIPYVWMFLSSMYVFSNTPINDDRLF